MKNKNIRIRRHKRVRAKIAGTASRPRLSIYRSNKHLFAQLIDDGARKTILGISDKSLKTKSGSSKTKTDFAYGVGLELAQKASKLGIKKAVFDRGGYQYRGRVRKAAEGAREGGLQF